MKRICSGLVGLLLMVGCLPGCSGDPPVSPASSGGTETTLLTTAASGTTTAADNSGYSTNISAGDTVVTGVTGKTNNKTQAVVTTKVQSPSQPSKAPTPSVDIGEDETGKFELPKFENVEGTTVDLFTFGSASSEGSKRWIKDFKDIYGATLKFSSVAQESYDATLSARMMSGDKPDVILVLTGGVYTYALNGYLEDLTGKIDLDSPLWKGVADLNRSRFISGKHYLAAVGAYVNDYIWFNRELMEDSGITDTPDVLYDRGEWTVEAMVNLAKEFTYTEKGTQYYGLTAHYQTLGGNLIIARGAVMAEQNSQGQFVSRTGSSEMADAMGMLYDMYNTDKVVMPNSKGDATLNTNAFYYGQAAMCQYSSSLSSQSRFAQKMKDRKISFVPFPKWDESTPSRQRGTVSVFAVGKGSDNVNGALAFISQRRYGTADVTEIERSNEERRTVYFNTDKEIQYLNEAKEDSVMASWEGLPKQQLMTMCQNISMGGSWTRTLNQFEPQFLQGLKELNDLMKN